MTLTKTGICDFGWKARDFKLERIDSKTYSLADVRGPKGSRAWAARSNERHNA